MSTREDLFNELLNSGPSSKTIYLLLSRLKEEGQLKRVIQECTKALHVHPYDIQIRQLLAESFIEAGLITQAEMELERITSQIGGLISVFKYKAEIYTSQGREAEAVEALKIYLAHRPDDRESLDLLRRLGPQEEVPVEPLRDRERFFASPEEAGEEVPAPGEGYPDIATPKLAEIYFDQGLIKEAIGTYEKVMEQQPDDRNSLSRLEELKRIMADETAGMGKTVDEEKQKKERIITILERWLGSIQETADVSFQ